VDLNLKKLAARSSQMLIWFEPYYRAIAIAVALFISVFATYSAWDFSRRAADSEAHARFEFRAAQIADAIRGRMGDYEQVLRGGVGLFAASEPVERQGWRIYVEHLRIQEIYPGIQGIGYARRVPAAAKAQHEQTVSADVGSRYAIQPTGDRPEYFPVVYIEPFSGRNLRAFGFDLHSEETGRVAMDRARDSGEPVISGKITLVQETDRDVQSGVLMFVPVYRNDLDSTTVARRQRALSGYVYGSFRMNDLMGGILGKLPSVRVELFDGNTMEASALLFDSLPQGTPHTPAFSTLTVLPVRGNTWTLRLTSLPDFDETIDRQTPQGAALTAGLISVLALMIIWSLATMRARAVRLARTMTRELRDSRERLALAVEGSNQALFDWDVVTGNVVLSEQWGQIIGSGYGSVTTTIRDLQAMVHPDELAQVRQQSAELIRGQILFYQVEHRVRTVTGGWRWVSSRAKVVDRDPMGRSGCSRS
jgi:CHASE1-domain containing sensor protein